MSQKHATLVVYRSDRNLWADGPLKCRVIELFGKSGPRVLVSRTIPPVVELELELSFDGGNAYGISVDANGHRSGWHVLSRRSFIRIDGVNQREVDSTIVRPMLVANHAQPSNLSAAFKTIENQGSPFALFGYQRFEALRSVAAKLAFLNIEAKLRETHIGTRSLLSFVRDVREAMADRIFLFVAAELKSLIQGSPDFGDAPGHGAPMEPPGLPAHPDSWKQITHDFGNLQLSFSKAASPQRLSGTTTEHCFSVDCDIDLERDLGHAFEFVHNVVFNKKTDQTLVYRMLWDQGVLPAYQLVPPMSAVAGNRVRVVEIGAKAGSRRRPRVSATRFDRSAGSAKTTRTQPATGAGRMVARRRHTTRKHR
jgi:hypothetical protein